MAMFPNSMKTIEAQQTLNAKKKRKKKEREVKHTRGT